MKNQGGGGGTLNKPAELRCPAWCRMFKRRDGTVPFDVSPIVPAPEPEVRTYAHVLVGADVRSCNCCLSLSSHRCGLCAVPSNVRTDATDQNAFRGRRPTTKKRVHVSTIQTGNDQVYVHVMRVWCCIFSASTIPLKSCMPLCMWL